MNKTSKFLLILSLIFMLLSVCFATENLYKNHNMVNGFSKRKTQNDFSYAEAIERENVDLNEISKFIPDAEAAVKEPDYNNIIISPVKIHYYKNINDDIPVYTISKGDVIQFDIRNRVRSRIAYRGVDTLPTNEKGWRLSKPFIKKGEKVNNELLYVKLDDLVSVTYEWFAQNINPNSMRNISGGIPAGYPRTKHAVALYILTYVDHCLYAHGEFLSKDILVPVFSVDVIFCFSASIISFILFLLYRKERNCRFHSVIKKVFCLKNR